MSVSHFLNHTGFFHLDFPVMLWWLYRIQLKRKSAGRLHLCSLQCCSPWHCPTPWRSWQNIFWVWRNRAYRWLEKLLQDAHIQAELVPNFQEVLWTKFLFVAPIAAVTTAYGLTFGQLIANKEVENKLKLLMEEVKQLALVKGVALKGRVIEESLNLMKQFPYNTKTSL